jgi:hypothetical protein
MGGECSTYGETGVYRVLVGKSDGKRQDPGMDESNIKIDLKEMGCGAWTGLIWLRIGTG